jgi:carbon monoxide dehydrogenase subunit G
MQMQHSFTVPVTVEEAWKVLLDVERIAPCLPGASLDSAEGDTFSGRVKVKVGPVSLTYKGQAEFLIKDEAAHHAVLSAKGKDARGSGTATAKIAMSLADEGTSTRVDVVTDLDLTGRPAQLGRGVISDVGERIIGQFAAALSDEIEADRASDAPLAPAGATKNVVPPRSATSQSPSITTSVGRPPAAVSRPATARATPDTINVLGLAGRSTLKIFATTVLNLVGRLFRRTPRR